MNQPLNPLDPTKDDFERYYAKEDPWSVRSSVRERDKIAKLNLEFAYCRFANGLDIGCGEGDLLQGLSFIDKKTGMDISERALATARRRFPSIDFRQGDLNDPASLPPGPFDFISCLETLYYISRDEQREAAVRSICSLGSARCVFLFSVVVIGANVHRRYFTHESALQLFSRHFNVLNYFPTQLDPGGRLARWRHRLLSEDKRIAELSRANLHRAYQSAFVCMRR